MQKTKKIILACFVAVLVIIGIGTVSGTFNKYVHGGKFAGDGWHYKGFKHSDKSTCNYSKWSGNLSQKHFRYKNYTNISLTDEEKTKAVQIARLDERVKALIDVADGAYETDVVKAIPHPRQDKYVRLLFVSDDDWKISAIVDLQNETVLSINTYKNLMSDPPHIRNSTSN